MKKVRIGIFGGTFDPLHNGHLYLAKMAKEEGNLDSVMFLPLNVPPHKPQPIASGSQRLEMINKAIKNYPDFFSSDIELNRSGTTYTVDTVNELLLIHPEYDIHYIIGQDSLLCLDTWKNAKELFTKCSFICLLRPNCDDYKDKLNKLQNMGAKIQVIEKMGLDVSSTKVKSSLDFINNVPCEILTDVINIYKGEQK